MLIRQTSATGKSEQLHAAVSQTFERVLWVVRAGVMMMMLVTIV